MTNHPGLSITWQQTFITLMRRIMAIKMGLAEGTGPIMDLVIWLWQYGKR